jgi:hypothetical protein
LFLHRKRDIWDHLAEEVRLHGELAVQLAATRQRVTELTPATEEVANLQIREADAYQHTIESEEKATTLIEQAHKDDAKAERVQKERDDLLHTVAGLCVEHDSAGRNTMMLMGGSTTSWVRSKQRGA